MPLSLAEAIAARAVRSLLPMGREGDTITLAAVADIARSHNVPGCRVEAEALKQGIHPTRYLRNLETITATDQISLLESSIAQVGLGGLGGGLLEMFLRAGVGHIRTADGDVFEESNLNRQALSTPDTLGIPKAEAALTRARHINPSAEVCARNEFLTPQTLPEFLTGTQLAIDALGGLTTRLALQQAAARADIPLVTGALAGWTGYVSVVLPGQTGPADIMGRDNAAEEKLGCPAPAVTFMASLMAAEAVKLLSGKPSSLAGTMLVIDLDTLTFDKIGL